MQTISRLNRFFIFLLLFTPFFLTGCGNGDDSSEGTTLQFAHFWSEPSQKAVLQQQIDAFEAENPGVTVELIDLSWNDGKQKLMAMFDGNQVPDVIELGSDWVAQFSESGRLMDLTTMPGDEPSRFSKEFLAPGEWESKLFARPWILGARGLFVNRALLEEAGISDSTFPSWESVLQAAEAVNQKFASADPKVYGIGVNGPDRNRLYKKVLPLFWSNGGTLFDAGGAPTINSPENVAALETYLTLGRNGRVDTQKELDQLFLAGRLGFWVSGPWLADRIAKENPELYYMVIGSPSLHGNPGVGFAGGEYLAIDNGSDHPELAQKLVTYLTSAKAALEFSKNIGGFAPADLSVENDPFLQEGVQRSFTEELKRSRLTPVNPHWLDIQDVLEESIERALVGEWTAQEALDNAQAKVVEIVS